VRALDKAGCFVARLRRGELFIIAKVMKDDGNGGGESVTNVDGGRGRGESADFVFHGFAIAGADEDGSGKGGVESSLDVDGFVTDEPGSGEVEVEFGGGIEDHAGVGFAEGVVGGEGSGAVGVVRAGPEAIEPGSVVLELEFDVGLDEVEVLPGVVAAGDAGLIGDDDGGDLALVEEADGMGGIGDEDGVLDGVEVAGFFDEDSIAVKEDGRGESGVGRVVAVEGTGGLQEFHGSGFFGKGSRRDRWVEYRFCIYIGTNYRREAVSNREDWS